MHTFISSLIRWDEAAQILMRLGLAFLLTLRGVEHLGFEAVSVEGRSADKNAS